MFTRINVFGEGGKVSLLVDKVEAWPTVDSLWPGPLCGVTPEVVAEANVAIAAANVVMKSAMAGSERWITVYVKDISLLMCWGWVADGDEFRVELDGCPFNPWP